MTDNLLDQLGIDEPKKGDEREVTMTQSEAKEELRKEAAKAQRDRHNNKQATWKPVKSEIDEMNEEELVEYLKESMINKESMRLGFITMKLNPYEYAAIKLAMMQTGTRSPRKMLVDAACKLMSIYKRESK